MSDAEEYERRSRPSFQGRATRKDLEDRERLAKERLGFGISYLDDALIGIFKDDLIVLGAYSGAGKTETATSIAMFNAALGKKVHYYALEASEREIENRIIYRLSAGEFFKAKGKADKFIDFANWKSALLPEMYPYDLQAQEYYENHLTGLKTYYRNKGLVLSEFVELFMNGVAHDKPDLVIVDHAHFFDWGDKSEQVGLKEIITHTREMNLNHNIPVIMISHLRKVDHKNKLYAPTIEEFHGSSEIYKQATKAILLGSGDMIGTTRVDTFINAVKFRQRGPVNRYTARGIYDFTTNTYDKGYELGEANQRRDAIFKELERDHYPKWAVHAVTDGSLAKSGIAAKGFNGNIGFKNVPRTAYKD